MQEKRLALYFGYGSGGHFLRGLRRSSLDPQTDCPGFPWGPQHLDSGLLVNGNIPDQPDGRVWWTCGYHGSDHDDDLWHAFYWWDRSGDSRPASNSGFYVRGFTLAERPEAFLFACNAWPEVVARQHYPLRVQPRA